MSLDQDKRVVAEEQEAIGELSERILEKQNHLRDKLNRVKESGNFEDVPEGFQQTAKQAEMEELLREDESKLDYAIEVMEKNLNNIMETFAFIDSLSELYDYGTVDESIVLDQNERINIQLIETEDQEQETEQPEPTS